MNIYIASPLFDNWTKMIVKETEKVLKAKMPDAEIFCPQDLEIPHAWEMDNFTWARAVHEADHKAIDEADLVVCISYGYQSDDGAAWEVGYAQARGKKCWLFVADMEEPYSLMFINVDKVFRYDGAVGNFELEEISKKSIEWK
mgnify:FL=1